MNLAYRYAKLLVQKFNVASPVVGWIGPPTGVWRRRAAVLAGMRIFKGLSRHLASSSSFIKQFSQLFDSFDHLASVHGSSPFVSVCPRPVLTPSQYNMKNDSQIVIGTSRGKSRALDRGVSFSKDCNCLLEYEREREKISPKPSEIRDLSVLLYWTSGLHIH